MPSFGLALQEMVIARLLERQARERPDRTFVHYGEERWSFAEVEAAAASLAGGLRELGVKAGDRVGLFLPNGPAFINAYFALGKLGATMVPVNTAYRGYMLEYLLNDTACEVLIVDATLLDRVIESADRLSSIETLVVAGAGADVATPWRTVAFETLPAEPLATDPSVTYADVNCVIYTSGTTGPSKGVPITNAHGISKAIEVIRLAEMGEDDVVYAPLPLFHSFALLRGVVAGLVTGGSCALRERFSASAFWGDVRATGATVGFCVFSIPQILAKAEPRADDRDHTLRVFYNARHDPEFEQRFGVRSIEATASRRRARRCTCAPARWRRPVRAAVSRRTGRCGSSTTTTWTCRWGDRRDRAAAALSRPDHARLPQQARGDRRRVPQPLVPHRRFSRRSTRTASTPSATARRTRSAAAARTSRRGRSSR